MKSRFLIRSLSAGSLAVLATTCLVLPIVPQKAAAQTQELRTEITYKDNRRQVGILINANEQVIAFALQQGAQAQNVAYTDLAAITFPDAASLMQGARNAYLQGKFEIAADAMSKIADAFPQAAYVPDNFASEARFYQMDSLRHLGKYSDIGRLFSTPTGKAMESALAEVFQPKIALLKLWAYYGAGNIDALGTEIESYLKAQVGDAKMLPDQQFNDGIAVDELAQLSFFRGKVHEKAESNVQALDDYYRSITVAQSNQPALAREAMTAAMGIMAADPALEEKASKKWPLQSLALVYKDAFNKGDIDAKFAEYAVTPDMPVAPVAARKEEPKEADEAPMTEEKPAGDADAKPKPEEKPKPAAKKKGE